MTIQLHHQIYTRVKLQITHQYNLSTQEKIITEVNTKMASYHSYH
jgi:hypothetical protein